MVDLVEKLKAIQFPVYPQKFPTISGFLESFREQKVIEPEVFGQANDILTLLLQWMKDGFSDNDFDKDFLKIIPNADALTSEALVVILRRMYEDETKFSDYTSFRASFRRFLDLISSPVQSSDKIRVPKVIACDYSPLMSREGGGIVMIDKKCLQAFDAFVNYIFDHLRVMETQKELLYSYSEFKKKHGVRFLPAGFDTLPDREKIAILKIIYYRVGSTRVYTRANSINVLKSLISIIEEKTKGTEQVIPSIPFLVAEIRENPTFESIRIIFPFPSILEFISRNEARFEKLKDITTKQITKMKLPKLRTAGIGVINDVTMVCRASVIVVLRKLLGHFESADISRILPSIIYRFPDEQKDWAIEGLARYVEIKLATEEKKGEDTTLIDAFVAEYLGNSPENPLREILRDFSDYSGISINEMNQLLLEIIRLKNIPLNLPRRYRPAIKIDPTQRNIFKRTKRRFLEREIKGFTSIPNLVQIGKLKIKDGIDGVIKVPDESFLETIRFINFEKMKILAEELPRKFTESTYTNTFAEIREIFRPPMTAVSLNETSRVDIFLFSLVKFLERKTITLIGNEGTQWSGMGKVVNLFVFISRMISATVLRLYGNLISKIEFTYVMKHKGASMPKTIQKEDQIRISSAINRLLDSFINVYVKDSDLNELDIAFETVRNGIANVGGEFRLRTREPEVKIVVPIVESLPKPVEIVQISEPIREKVDVSVEIHETRESRLLDSLYKFMSKSGGIVPSGDVGIMKVDEMDYRSKFDFYSRMKNEIEDARIKSRKFDIISEMNEFFASKEVKRVSYPYLIDSNLEVVQGFNINYFFNSLKPYEKVVVMDLITLTDMKFDVVTFNKDEPWVSSKYDPVNLKRCTREYLGNIATVEQQTRVLESYSYIFTTEFNKKPIEERMQIIGKDILLKNEMEKMANSLLPKIEEENQRLLEEEIREAINKSKEPIQSNAPLLIPELKDAYRRWRELVKEIMVLDERIKKEGSDLPLENALRTAIAEKDAIESKAFLLELDGEEKIPENVIRGAFQSASEYKQWVNFVEELKSKTTSTGRSGEERIPERVSEVIRETILSVPEYRQWIDLINEIKTIRKRIREGKEEKGDENILERKIEQRRKIEFEHGNKFLPLHGSLVNNVIETGAELLYQIKYLEYRRLINDVISLSTRAGLEYDESTNSLKKKDIPPVESFIFQGKNGQENLKIFHEEFLLRFFRERQYSVKTIPASILTKTSDFPRLWKFFYGIRENESIRSLLQLFVEDISTIEYAMDIVEIISLVVPENLKTPITGVVNVVKQCQTAESRRTSLLSMTTIEGVIEYLKSPNSLVSQQIRVPLIPGVYRTEMDLINYLKKDTVGRGDWSVVDEIITGLQKTGKLTEIISSFTGSLNTSVSEQLAGLMTLSTIFPPSLGEGVKQKIISELFQETKLMTDYLDEELYSLRIGIGMRRGVPKEELSEFEISFTILEGDYNRKVESINKLKRKAISFSVFRLLQKIKFYSSIQQEKEKIINEVENGAEFRSKKAEDIVNSLDPEKISEWLSEAKVQSLENWYQWMQLSTGIRRPKVRAGRFRRVVITEKDFPKISEIFPNIERKVGTYLEISKPPSSEIPPYEKIAKIIRNKKRGLLSVADSTGREGVDSLWLSEYFSVTSYSGVPREYEIAKSNIGCFKGKLAHKIEVLNEYFEVDSKGADILFINPNWLSFEDSIARKKTGSIFCLQEIGSRECTPEELRNEFKNIFSNPLDTTHLLDILDEIKIFLPKYGFVVVKIPYYYEIAKLRELGSDFSFRLVHPESEYGYNLINFVDLDTNTQNAITDGLRKKWEEVIKRGGGYISWDKNDRNQFVLRVSRGNRRIDVRGSPSISWRDEFHIFPSGTVGRRFIYIVESFAKDEVKLIASENEVRIPRSVKIGEIEIKSDGIEVKRGFHDLLVTINLRNVSTEFLEAKIVLGGVIEKIKVLKRLPRRIIQKMRSHSWVVIYRNEPPVGKVKEVEREHVEYAEFEEKEEIPLEMEMPLEEETEGEIEEETEEKEEKKEEEKEKKEEKEEKIEGVPEGDEETTFVEEASDEEKLGGEDYPEEEKEEEDFVEEEF
jgi:hypothetical protein